MKFMAGCDPEIFMKNMSGQLVSSIGRIGGSKYAPMPLPIGDGYAVQEDNVAMEFNIPPAANREEFVASIKKTLDFLSKSIKLGYDFELSHLSAAMFPDSELQDPAALEFGCDPDFNAWTKEKNPRPSAADKSLRSCGGHVHIGYDKSVIDPLVIIRNMDLYCGVPSVLMDNGELRKQLYGKAGAYREKPYGVEYRTLSNFWIFDEKLISWVYNNTARAVQAAESRFTFDDDAQQAIQKAINNNDKGLAKSLVNHYGLEVI